MDEHLNSHKRYATSIAERAKARAALVGHAAPDWELEDVVGRRHALREYRGKVVVLDFWNRGCGWCIRAMPQLKQLAGDFRDRPVAVLGMSTDRDPADAKFVIEKMELTYPNIKAAGLADKYGVIGVPTLIVIDQNGVIRELHVGYSPTLRKDVAAEIERLLTVPGDTRSPTRPAASRVLGPQLWIHGLWRKRAVRHGL